MKKIALISFVAVAALVSCQKEALTEGAQIHESLVFTASIAADGTKTTLSDDNPAKIYWESTDKITIKDDASHEAVYKLKTGAGETRATFEYESGSALDASSTYTATYGAAPANYQVYSSAGSVPLYMKAPATSSTDGLAFTPQCGVLRVTLTDASHDIMRVEVSDGSGNTYKVTSSSAVDIASATKFYLALPEGTYTSLNIYDDNFQMVSKTGISLTVAAGHIKPAANTSALSFTDCTTKGFRGTHAVVQLWKKGPFWAETNIGAATPEDNGQYFAWGYAEGCVRNSAGTGWVLASDGTTVKQFSTGFFSDRDTATYQDPAASNWNAAEWGAPTYAQLRTLINKDSSGKCSVSYVTSGTVGIKVTGTGDYASNSIFLPAVGYGYNSEIGYGASIGRYWSSSEDKYLSFNPANGTSDVTIGSEKHLGFPVRPVYSIAEPVTISGKFSVSALKKVRFTNGNLYWDGSAWGIEASQTDYPTTWDVTHAGHLFWSKTASVAYSGTYSDTAAADDKLFCAESSPLTVEGQSGLYALAKDEWAYLISSRANASSLCKYGVTVTNEGKSYANCLIMAPDDFTGTLKAAYTLEEVDAAGLVCLPAAGYRDGMYLNSAGVFGYCWSATLDAKDYPWYLNYGSSSVGMGNGSYRYNGSPIRLVCTVSD